MEGTPVRGQQKAAIVQLNGAANLETFQGEIVRVFGSEFRSAQVFFAIMDSNSRVLQLPSWIKSHFERHAGLYAKLEQGEMIGISATEDHPVPRPAVAARSTVVLIPVLSESRLRAAIGLVSPPDKPPMSAEDVELARQFAYDIAPILARFQEIESLKREKQELLARADRSVRAEADLAAVSEDRSSLEAVLQMRSHQQINIAHELRTPLAAIRGYARMILDGRSGAINDKQRDYLQVVTDNTNRLITLVSWMSYIAELSAQHLVLSSFDFRDVWAECLKNNDGRLAEKSLKLRQYIADEPFTITGDREKLADVLTDLITAVLRLSAEAGTLTMEMTHGRERELNFKLSGTGAEIPAYVLSTIFDRPFNKIDKPAALNTASNALSLSGVYDIIGMHGGRVFVNSAGGKCATFLFTLPAITAEAEGNSHEQTIHFGRRRR